MADTTFLWFDYETFGTQPRRDWPAQFAAVRTDAELNEAGAPLMLYCRPPTDRLPAPEACLITGITPQLCAEKGLPEHVFAQEINAAFSVPHTIAAGYNSIHFDDEVTRFLLWRNLIDPYAREWRDGCSRWDLLDVVRCAHALRPEGIQWPTGEGGQPSFKLTALTAANGIAHASAHDALADVRATIALARLVRHANPRLFDFCLALRSKQRVVQELGLPATLREAQMFLHVSGRFAAERGCIAVMAPLAMHPENRNEVLAWDLQSDPSELADLHAEEVRTRLFTPAAQLPEGVQRLPIKGVHLNRAPVVVRNARTLRPELATRWGIDLALAQDHLEKLRALPDLSTLWKEVFTRPDAAAPADVDEDLYGGFLSDADRRRLDQLRALPPAELALTQPGFDDPRLPELLQRYRARNFPETLSAAERTAWEAHRRARLLQGAAGATPVTAYFERIDALAETAEDERSQDILSALYDWAEQIVPADAAE